MQYKEDKVSFTDIHINDKHQMNFTVRKSILSLPDLPPVKFCILFYIYGK